MLNSLAPSYPFTFHLNIRFAYKQYLRKNILQHHCSSVLLVCLERQREAIRKYANYGSNGRQKSLCAWSPAPCSPEAAVLSPAGRAESGLRKGRPPVGHRQENTRSPGSTGSGRSGGAVTCRPGLLRSKAEYILEQMVLFCNHWLQVGLAHICTDAC